MKKFLTIIGILCLGFSSVFAQTVQVSGTVSSADDGETLPGVTVLVKGTFVGTVTNVDGRYSFEVPANATLQFSFVGMTTQEVEVAGRQIIDVVMTAGANVLDEVVVTALGISRERKSLGYAVQDVKGESLSMAKDPNLLKSVAGKVAGVNITSTTGALGASARIQIRGISTFTGDNQPLFVVDGIPILNSRITANDVDLGNNASALDPETIETMSVLKGPSATALYGSRGMNGVVLITTKQGQMGKRATEITFSSSLTFDKVSTMPKYQNKYGQGEFGDEYTYQLYKESGGTLSYQDYARTESFNYVDGRGNGVGDDVDESWGARLDAGLLVDQFHGKNQPWISHPNNIRDIYETGMSFTNSLSINAAAENVAGRITYTNDNFTGVFPNTDIKRNNINGNIVINLGKRVKADMNITYNNAYSNNLPGGGYNAGNPMQMAGWFGRQVDTKLLKENWDTFFENTGYPYNWISLYHNNPWFTANKMIRKNNQDRVFGNFGLTFTLAQGLNLLTRIGYDTNSYDTNFHNPAWNIDLPRTANGRFEWNTGRRGELNMDAILSYQKYFGDFSISAMAGANSRDYSARFSRLTANALTIPDFFSIRNVSGSPGYDKYNRHKRTNSVFGSANFGYRNWLYLDVTARNDWTSALSPDNWSYFYPSVGLGFIFTDAFGIQSNILSFGKLRTSWAQVGSDTGEYSLSMTYGSSTAISGFNQSNYTGTLVDPLLRPQRKTSIEVGADLRFLNNRISFDFTWYQDKTKDQIMDVPISYASGFSVTKLNAGLIQNSGMEIMLSGRILDNRDGLNWTSTVNWSTNKGKVLELYGDVKSINFGNSWGMAYVRGYVGERLGDMYTIVRQKNDNGDYLIEGGSYMGSEEMENVGNVMPDWIAGWNNEFHYKNFNLSFLLNSKMGGKMFCMTSWFGLYSGVLEATAEGDIREKGCLLKGIDIDTNMPNATRISAMERFNYGSGSVWDIPEQCIITPSFIKLQEVVFGYSLPQTMVNRIGFIKGANLSFVARNVALLWIHKSNANIVGIDPDTQRGLDISDMGQEDYSAPPVRSLGLKLTLNF